MSNYKYYPNHRTVFWSRDMYVNEYIDDNMILTKKEEITFVTDDRYEFMEQCLEYKNLKRTFYCKGGFTIKRVMILAQYFMMLVDEVCYKYEDIGRLYEDDTGFDGFEFCEESARARIITCS